MIYVSLYERVVLFILLIYLNSNRYDTIMYDTIFKFFRYKPVRIVNYCTL